jgi:hypothetical protein
VLNPYTISPAIFSGIGHQLSELGYAICELHLAPSDARGQILRSMSQAAKDGLSNSVLLDLINLLDHMQLAPPTTMTVISRLTGETLYLQNENADYSNVHFDNCYISAVQATGTDAQRLPWFKNCAIEVFRSPLDQKSVTERVTGEIETYEALYRGLAHLKESGSDDRIIALVSILEKLFDRYQSGRLDTALRRGLSQQQGAHVPAVLKLLKQRGAVNLIVRRGNRIWLPIKSFVGTAAAIMQNPVAATDKIVDKVLQL